MKKERFFMMTRKEKTVEPVLGEKYDDNLFIVRKDGSWFIVDIKTGILVITGSTRKNLLEKFISWGYKARYDELLENAKNDRKHYYNKLVANLENAIYEYEKNI